MCVHGWLLRRPWSLSWCFLLPLPLRFQVLASRSHPQGSLPSVRAWVSSSQPCVDFNHLSNAQSGQTPVFRQYLMTWLSPSSRQRLKQAGEAPRFQASAHCLLSLSHILPFPHSLLLPWPHSLQKKCSNGHQDGLAPRIQEKAWKSGQIANGKFSSNYKSKTPPKGQTTRTCASSSPHPILPPLNKAFNLNLNG